MLARAQVRILFTNRLLLVKGAKKTLQDKRASPTKKSSAGTKSLVDEVPASMHYSEVCEWGEGGAAWVGKVRHAGCLLYAGWLDIVSPQLRYTNTQAVVCQSHLA